jgi:hypothetical protein
MSQFKDKSFAEVLEVLREKGIEILKSGYRPVIRYSSKRAMFFYYLDTKELSYIEGKNIKRLNEFKQILLDLGFEVRE